MTKYIMLAWQVDIDARIKVLEQRDPNGLAVEPTIRGRVWSTRTQL